MPHQSPVLTRGQNHRPRILLLSGYDAASHRRWRKQLTRLLTDYEWHTLALPPRFFRWRIRGNPLSWLNEPCLQQHWDLLVVTSMVDLATLKGIHPRLGQIPSLLYMHENQFVFPLSGKERSSVEPQMVNLYSAVSADRVVFNSAWNQQSFFAGAKAFLDMMPDEVPGGLVETLKQKSSVLPVPIEDRLFSDDPEPANWHCPHLLWNHRWEYDKGPERLALLLAELDRRELPFRLSVVGEQFRSRPPTFDQIRQRFHDRIEQWGYIESRADYDQLLRQADVVVSTALHDFQGLSMLEAMACGCVALAPDRLAYREYVPAGCRYASHEQDAEAEARAAADCLETMVQQRPLAQQPTPWRASVLAQGYQALFAELIESGKRRRESRPL